MFLGKVVGYVWSSVKWPELKGMRMLLIKPLHYDEIEGAGNGPDFDAVVAADILGAGPGEDVIVAYGHAARVGIEDLPDGELPHFPVDAAVVAIVDNFFVKKDEENNN